MVHTLKNYAQCFAIENGLAPKDVRLVDMAK